MRTFPLEAVPLTATRSMRLAIAALLALQCLFPVHGLVLTPTKHQQFQRSSGLRRCQRCRSFPARASRENACAVGPVALERGEEMKGWSTRLPEDHLLRPVFQQLEQVLTREVFEDVDWRNSCEYVLRIAVSLASCVEPFAESPRLPLEHAEALSLVTRLTERCKELDKKCSDVSLDREGLPAGLHSSLKYCTKKNGLGRAAGEVARDVLPSYGCMRERAAAIRGVERCLSEFCIVWSTARLLSSHADPATKRDLIFHLRPLLEHAPARDRHEAVLVLCRGLFTPQNDVVESKREHHVFAAVFQPESGGYPLASAFAEVHEGSAKYPRALRAARQAFPFLEPLARWSWRCQRPEVSPSPVGDSHSQSNGIVQANMDIGTTAIHQDGENRTQDRSRKRKKRGRSNTGVASLLVALAKADPSGETIKSLMRWACEGLMPEQVGEAPWSAAGTLVDRNEVARCLMSTRESFIEWQDASHLRWMKSCREAGDVLRLLVGAVDDDRLEGADLTSEVNHALFVTTFLRTMPEGAKARRGYERLVGSGIVPGEAISFSAERGAKEKVTNWRGAAGVMNLGMASVLRVSEETIRSKEFRQTLSSVLKTWKSPQILADYYNIQQKEAKVMGNYLRFLRALLGASNESIHDIRFRDPANEQQMRHVPARARQLWEAEPCTLAGTSDPEVIFRMGEDTRSCMGIQRACIKTNRGLLGYLIQGNVRFVGVQSSMGGRMDARAVLRLLVRSDTKEAVLFMDKIYYSSNRDATLERKVLEQAKSVSDDLGIPLFRAGDTVLRPPSSTPKEIHGEDGVLISGPRAVLARRKPKVCHLVEVNGLARFVHSDAPVAPLDTAGMLVREDPIPGTNYDVGRLVLAELGYTENLL
ncbi:unnamed protein product [Scytosiphon promiscuus]